MNSGAKKSTGLGAISAVSVNDSETLSIPTVSSKTLCVYLKNREAISKNWFKFKLRYMRTFCTLCDHHKHKDHYCYVMTIIVSFFVFFFNVSWFQRERERKRKRNTDVKKKYWFVASHTHPDWGANLQPRYVPLLGIEPPTFWYAAQWSTLAKVIVSVLELSLCARNIFKYLKISHIDYIVQCSEQQNKIPLWFPFADELWNLNLVTRFLAYIPYFHQKLKNYYNLW